MSNSMSPEKADKKLKKSKKTEKETKSSKEGKEKKVRRKEKKDKATEKEAVSDAASPADEAKADKSKADESKADESITDAAPSKKRSREDDEEPRKRMRTRSISRSEDTAADVEAYIATHEIKLSGDDLPTPTMNFDMFPSKIQDILTKDMGFTKPSPIQAASWPATLKGRDVVAIAKTGSGKTCGFILPGVLHIKQKRKTNTRGDAPIMLVLAPTRELAMQIASEADRFCKPYNVRVRCVYGGVPRGEQIRGCRDGCDILIACPGRLLDFESFNQVSLKSVSFLVLDEADRMLDMGFEPDLKKVMERVPKEHQTLFFSATWPKQVKKLASTFLNHSPLEIHIGNTSKELVASKSIKQIVQIHRGNDAKETALDALLTELNGSEGTDILKTIIFGGTKRNVDNLSYCLNEAGWPCGKMHGDMEQWERDKTLKKFRSGGLQLLVATDVAARGLDVPDISFVINYDLPLSMEDYIHRIGRTGRAGKEGTAYTFFDPKRDSKNGRELVKIMTNAEQEVPQELATLAENSRGGFSGHPSRGGRRGGWRGNRSGGRGRGRR